MRPKIMRSNTIKLTAKLVPGEDVHVFMPDGKEVSDKCFSLTIIPGSAYVTMAEPINKPIHLVQSIDGREISQKNYPVELIEGTWDRLVGPINET